MLPCTESRRHASYWPAWNQSHPSYCRIIHQIFRHEYEIEIGWTLKSMPQWAIIRKKSTIFGKLLSKGIIILVLDVIICNHYIYSLIIYCTIFSIFSLLIYMGYIRWLLLQLMSLFCNIAPPHTILDSPINLVML